MSEENQTEDSQIKVSIKLIQELRTFAAATNNYLMTIPVEGDNILMSASLMTDANKLFSELDKLKAKK